MQGQTTYPEPFPHIIIDNFFRVDILSALLKIPRISSSSDLYEFERTEDLIAFTPLAAFITTLHTVGRKWADEVGVVLNGHVDCAFFRYLPTHYLLPHDDRMPGRKIAYVFYLSECTGGELALYNSVDGNPITVTKVIAPSAGRLVLFLVGDSFHRVNEVLNGTRYSLAGWFYGN